MAIPGFSASATLRPAQVSAATSVARARVALVLPCIYGRWCGPGCGGPGPPVDDLDACCQGHDGCYDQRGYFACSCDRELLACVTPKINLWTAKGRAAYAVYAWFSRGWCNPFV
jgi:hypothetical protein